MRWSNWLRYRRFPWVRVAEARDCGAAVFASIARFYGHQITLEQARNLVDTDRNGTTLAGLRDGGRAIGLESRPARASYEALAEIHLPAILHLNGQEGHYVVLCAWTPNAVVILDPNRGLRELSREDLVANWSGFLVEFLPTPNLQLRELDVRPLRFALSLARPNLGLLALGLGLALVATALGWAASFFLEVLVDRILPNHEAGLLFAFGLSLVLLSGIQALLQFARLWLAAHLGRRIQLDYGEQFIAQLLRLPLAVFDSRCVAGLVMRITQIDLVQQAITEALVALITDTTLFVAALGVIFLYDHLAAAITLGAIPLIVGVTVLLDDRVANSQLTWMVRLEEFGSHMVDTFDSLRTVKTFSAEERYLGLLMSKLERLAEARRASRVALAHPVAWSLLATSAITMGILWYGGNELLQGRLTTGALLVLFGMVSFCLGPVQRFPSTALAIRTALVAIERLEEIRTLPDERDRVANPIPLPRARGQVTFDQVSFAYRRHRPILSDVSFTIQPGETIAIVGETGSGKTSLANLIAGFYLPTIGDVRIDGISTRDLDPGELRRSISAVFQDPKLLQQSIRDNITLLADASIDEVRQAARRANADDFISRLINGYDSQVARGGDNFSSGQSQRIALARAFLKDAPILILDEATSNLDGETEHAILQALEANRRRRTTIVIAHRLSTVLGADRVFVLDEGRLVETGTHQELLQRRGRYYELFHWQIVEASAASELATAGGLNG